MSLEGEDVLQQRCAAVSTLWIVVWFGAKTGLLLVDDHDTVFECGCECDKKHNTSSVFG